MKDYRRIDCKNVIKNYRQINDKVAIKIYRRIDCKDVSNGLTGARARRLRRCDVTEDGRSVFIANDATHLIDVVCRHFLLLKNQTIEEHRPSVFIANDATHPYMSLAKNVGGRVGVKENFKGGGGVKKFSKILLQICDNPERSPKFSEKMAFFSQKSNFLQKCHFFSKILLRKILCGGRVAFKENFIGGEGIL
jgi:hypothetical protein